MKYAKYGLVFSFVIGALGIVGSFKVPKSFGKTHFIIGFPKGALCTTTADTSNATAGVKQSGRETNQAKHEGGVHGVLFAHDDNLQERLVQLISHEKRSIKMAIFMITTKEIIHALLAAHARGVKITIITDNICVRDRWSKIDTLKKAGIAMYEYTPAKTSNRMMNDLMHNKFVIFADTLDHQSLVWTGSFNFTRSAQVCNQENVVILSDSAAVEKFAQQFKRLKKRSKRLQ
jgi:cardiolipin hydrolase